MQCTLSACRCCQAIANATTGLWPHFWCARNVPEKFHLLGHRFALPESFYCNITKPQNGSHVVVLRACAKQVIDLISLKPFDLETITKSIKKTRKCIIVEECMKTGGIGASLSAVINESLFNELDHEVASNPLAMNSLHFIKHRQPSCPCSNCIWLIAHTQNHSGLVSGIGHQFLSPRTKPCMVNERKLQGTAFAF